MSEKSGSSRPTPLEHRDSHIYRGVGYASQQEDVDGVAEARGALRAYYKTMWFGQEHRLFIFLGAIKRLLAGAAPGGWLVLSNGSDYG